MWNGMHGTGYGWGMGGAAMAMGLIWVLLVVVGLWAAVTAWGRGPSRPTGRRDESQGPLEVLQHRYARGEIDSREFEERRQKLTESTTSGARSTDPGHVSV